MAKFMWRYWNQPRKVHSRPGRWIPKRSAPVPGHIGDPKNKLPGGFRRFDRWERMPVRAWKLYWRRHANEF